jgi:hypothetical protein
MAELSEGEKVALKSIERQLRSQDPSFAGKLEYSGRGNLLCRLAHVRRWYAVTAFALALLFALVSVTIAFVP